MVVEVRFSQLLIRLKSPYLPSQRSCGTVKFSQVSVSHSVHRGRGVCLSACWDTSLRQVHPPPGRFTPRAGTPLSQVHPPGRFTPLGRYTPPGRYTPRQVHPLAGTPWAGTPAPAGTPPSRCTPPWGRYTPQVDTSPWEVSAPTPTPMIVTAADGTHPTGMLSCL